MKSPDSAQALIEYGAWLMAAVAGRANAGPPVWAAQFVEKLGDAGQEDGPAPLEAILTLVMADAATPAPAAYLRPVPLGLGEAGDEWALFPTADRTAATDASRRGALYDEFAAATQGETNFDRFFHLMRKYASTLPNTYGEPGVSLFEQWKLVAALVEIGGSTAKPPDALGLVGGDIPGIQRTINLVTAKGAAKAMRGRSAFIQFLGHALTQRLLAELGLGPANVVYDAGGNFVLLTGWRDGEDGTAAKVRQVADAVNRLLLGGTEGSRAFDGFHGDLAVALAAIPLEGGLAVLQWDSATQAGGAPSAWQQAESGLKEAVAAAKRRPFGDLARQREEDWTLLFAPEPSNTNEFCAVCRRQLDEGEALPLEADDEASPLGSNRICPECQGFNELADDLGHDAARLKLARTEPRAAEAWQRALHAVTGLWYVIEKEPPLQLRHLERDTVLVFEPDQFPTQASGFRWLSHTTPTKPVDGRTTIKTNNELAGVSEGFKRLGILRMDVDSLGERLVMGLPGRTLAQTAELSQALERFFAGWLDRICARVDGGAKLFYVLFAGGDDLFVIGPWHLIPELAKEIRNDFTRYCGENPALRISAGIAVTGSHAPLHRAAEEAHDALEEAKGLDEGTPAAKDAITFLGRTHHWAEFAEVWRLKEDILDLAAEPGLENALITRLLAIDRRYRRDRQRGRYAKGQTRGAVYYGPWMWQQAYALARLKHGRSEEVGGKLDDLGKKLLDKEQIAQLGLAARWAQWLRRD